MFIEAGKLEGWNDSWDDYPESVHLMWAESAVTHLKTAFPCLTEATEENIALMRDTPIGRALMAEGWRRGWNDSEQYELDVQSREVPETGRNPYEG